METPLDAIAIKASRGNPLPEPFHTTMGEFETRRMARHFGLTAIAVNLVHLEPGCQSALRHWHLKNEEFVYMLAGELVLITDEGETVMKPGMVAGFIGGEENAHHLVNRSNEIASHIVVGCLLGGDRAHYPDDDMKWVKNEGEPRRAAHKDGSYY